MLPGKRHRPISTEPPLLQCSSSNSNIDLERDASASLSFFRLDTPQTNAWKLHTAGLVVTAAMGALTWFSHGELSVWKWLTLFSVAWMAFLMAFLSARDVSPKQLLVTLWCWAIALRVVGLVGQPIFEDDFFRYLWDGRQFAVSGNPYQSPPAAHFADASVPEVFQDVLSRINHPDVPTIYGPLCQFVFLLGYWIAPAQLWPIKLLLIAADLAALWFLLRLVAPRQALLYAWCPLLVQETAFTAHPEILGIAPIIIALWGRREQLWIVTGFCCALAVAARIPAILVVPFVLWPVRGKALLAFACTLGLLYAPFWVQGSDADFAALRAFGSEWEFNSSVFAIIKAVGGWEFAKLSCAILFLSFYAAWWLRHRNAPVVRGDIVFGAFFLLSAVVNPWYVLWLLPFVAMRPSAAGLAALAAVSLSYLHGANLQLRALGSYDHPQWLRPLEYGIVLAAALFDWRRNLFAAKRNAD